MTNTPHTSPEAIQDALKSCAAYHVPTHRLAVLHALSAKLEATEARERALLQSNDQERKALVENASIRHRLKAAEAELAEAKMHVAEMITAFEEHVALPDKNCSCHISPPCGDCTENDYARETLSEARAFRARQKETDT